MQFSFRVGRDEQPQYPCFQRRYPQRVNDRLDRFHVIHTEIDEAYKLDIVVSKFSKWKDRHEPLQVRNIIATTLVQALTRSEYSMPFP